MCPGNEFWCLSVMVYSLGGFVSCCGGHRDGNCPQTGDSIAVYGKDGDIVVSDSQGFSCERGGTPNIAQLANAE
jgi:hypothetical protein